MANLPDDTRPEPVDLLAGLIADQRDRTERGAVLGARDDIDQAMTANYRLTGDAMTDQPVTVGIDKVSDDNPYCMRCGDTRGGPYGHETNECTWNDPCAGCDCAQLLASVCLRRAAGNIARRFQADQ